MKNSLFAEAPDGRGMDNALVGGRWAGCYAYINSYYLAASVLAEEALRGQPKDLLFYPMCFNYRHCIELHLKALIVEARQLHGVLTELREPVGQLPPEPKGLKTQHRLSVLLDYVEKLLALFPADDMNASVKTTILDLDQIDVDGQGFRYDKRQDNKPTLPSGAWVDVRNVMERMKEAHFHLHGIDMWMADRRGTAGSILAAMGPNDC